MKTMIYYFSGTGNSLAAAKTLANSLDTVVDLLPIAGSEKEQSVEVDCDLLGLVFPVHFLSMPDMVRGFLKKLNFKSDPYIFAIATCNRQPGKSLYVIDRMLKKKGKSLAAGFTLDMPGNSLIGKVDLTNPPEVQKARLDNTPVKLSTAGSAQQKILLRTKNESRYGGNIASYVWRVYIGALSKRSIWKYILSERQDTTIPKLR
ncbi:MAG: flavodoxin family protein [Firmicutes bacterium]|nr:flavodoxin family protein [Bacillota bacterium]